MWIEFERRLVILSFKCFGKEVFPEPERYQAFNDLIHDKKLFKVFYVYMKEHGLPWPL